MTRKIVMLWVVALALFGLSSPSEATYNAMNVRTVVAVQTYYQQDGLNSFLVDSIPSYCASTQLVLSTGSTAAAARSMLAILLAAQLSGKKVEIYYDTTTGCGVEYVRMVNY